jgi:pyrroline-5-carboxylate reductase
MATAIARGLVDNGVFTTAELAAVDVSAAARAAFTAATGVACGDDAAAAIEPADAVLLAVKPQVAAAAVAPVAGLCGGKLVISICAGLPVAKLAGWFSHERIIRVMPNTPVTVGRGAAVFYCGAGASAADRALAEQIFGAVGIVLEMDEAQLDGVTALSGSGPAYVFEMIQALIDGAVAIGLPPDAAFALTVQTVAGAAEMVQRGLGTPDELRVAVTSPGGTTAAGLAVLSAAGFRDLIAIVLRAARDRSVELGRG